MKLGFVFLAVMAVAACQAQNQTVSRDAFDPSKISYFKDGRTEICFAVIAYQRVDSRLTVGYGQSMAAVQCSPAIEQLAAAH